MELHFLCSPFNVFFFLISNQVAKGLNIKNGLKSKH